VGSYESSKQGERARGAIRRKDSKGRAWADKKSARIKDSEGIHKGPKSSLSRNLEVPILKIQTPKTTKTAKTNKGGKVTLNIVKHKRTIHKEKTNG
jgi:hypothetical protein